MGASSIAAQVAALHEMTVPQLRLRYLEVMGFPTKQRHRVQLIKRIARELQSDTLPRLSAEEEAKVTEYQAMLKSMPCNRWFPGKQRRPKRPSRPTKRQPPKPGSVITRQYNGQEIAVTVREDGFEYAGQMYRSLSAIARKVTGTTWNGWRWFGLSPKGGRS